MCLLKTVIQTYSGHEVLNDILVASSSYVTVSTKDSCNVVRDISRNIIEYLRTSQKSSFAKYFDGDDSGWRVLNRVKSPVGPKKSVVKNETAPIVKKHTSAMGKAQRVKIVP